MGKSDRQCHRFLVSGRVQGVFYRGSTLDKARDLQLCGFVRNLKDGRVEILACGEIPVLVTFRGWLWQGPPMAQVDQVSVEPVEFPASLSTFEVL